MIIFVNDRNEIKDVGASSDASLTPITVTDGTFDGWSKSKICCYKVTVSDGNVTMLTPYVDSRMIEHFDQSAKESEQTIGGVYSDKQTYTDGMYCLQGGNLYRFKQMQGRGIEPQNETYWELCDVASELNRIVNMIKA